MAKLGFRKITGYKGKEPQDEVREGNEAGLGESDAVIAVETP